MKHLFILHGLPAAGKLTVGSLAHQKVESQLSGVRFFHNHLVVDAVKALFDFGTDSFIEMRYCKRLIESQTPVGQTR
jgi:hypothetical protein